MGIAAEETCRDERGIGKEMIKKTDEEYIRWIKVGSKEKFIDLLFYNTRLHCYVVVEVKAGEFDSSNMGQLGTYVVAVNHQIKTEYDNPTIGLVVCKGMDKIEAQYALEASSQPLGVSSYELSKLVPDEFKGSIPTIEEIEGDLNNL